MTVVANSSTKDKDRQTGSPLEVLLVFLRLGLTCFGGFDRGATLSARWPSLARTKLEELDALVAKASGMRRTIKAGLQCGCVRLEDCALSPTNRAASAPKRRSRATQKVRA